MPLGEPRGTVTPEAAAHLGIADDAVVTGATIDSVTSAIGTGAVDDDRCGLIIGTTAVMATHLPSKRHDLEHGFTTAPSPLPDQYFLVAENGIGGKALDVFVNNSCTPTTAWACPCPSDSYDAGPCRSRGRAVRSRTA